MDAHDLVFLVDVDDTLLDNDRFQDDLKTHLAATAGSACRDRYWAIQERLFQTLGYRDYLGAFQHYRHDVPDDMDVVWLASFVTDYPFADLLYPGALDLLARMRTLGRTVILTDGDAVFQPRKLERSGLAAAVDRHALIYIHKQAALAEIERRYPARRYILVDDKVTILSAFKLAWGDRVTTVFPRQGQYARDAKLLAAEPTPDLTIAAIGDLLDETVFAALKLGIP